MDTKGDNKRNISIHTPYAGSDDCTALWSRPLSISIHTPYAGSDHSSDDYPIHTIISIHTPYAGSDPNLQAFV